MKIKLVIALIGLLSLWYFVNRSRQIPEESTKGLLEENVSDKTTEAPTQTPVKKFESQRPSVLAQASGETTFEQEPKVQGNNEFKNGEIKGAGESHKLSHAEQAKALYQRLKNISIEEELKQHLKPLDRALGPEEKFFPYAYKGNLIDDPEKRIVRLNLSLKNFGPDLTSNACFFMGTTEKMQVEASGIDGRIHILRSNEPGYIVVNIDNNYYLQIFQTTEKTNRKFNAILSIRKPSKKYEMVLEGIDGELAAGRLLPCYELSLPR